MPKSETPKEADDKAAEKEGVRVIETGPETSRHDATDLVGSLEQRLADENTSPEILAAELQTARLNGDDEKVKAITARLKNLGQ